VLQQNLDGQAVVHLLAAPTCGGSVLVDPDVLLFVVVQQLEVRLTQS